MAITRVVSYNSYELPNVLTVGPVSRIPLRLNGATIGHTESIQIAGLLQADTNAAFDSAKSALETALDASSLDQAFSVIVTIDGDGGKTRFNYNPLTSNSLQRADISLTYTGGKNKTELSYPYSVSFRHYPANISTGSGADPLYEQSVVTSYDAAGYDRITKTGVCITARGTSAKEKFLEDLDTNAFTMLSSDVNGWERGPYSVNTDALDCRASYSIQEIWKPVVIKVGSKEPFNSISINTSLIQQNGETFVNVNINARIDRGTAYQADLTNSDIIQTYYPKLKDEADKIASSFNDRKIIGGKSKGVKLVQRDPMNWASETGTISCGFRYSYALGKRGAGVVEYSANSTLSVVRPHRWYIIGDAYVKVLSAPMFRRMSFSGSMTLFDAKSVPKAYAGYKPPGGKWVKDGNDSVTSGDPKLSIDGWTMKVSWSVGYREEKGKTSGNIGIKSEGQAEGKSTPRWGK